MKISASFAIRRALIGATAGATALWLQLPALAQQGQAPTAVQLPSPGEPPEPRYWVGYLVSFLLFGLVMFVSLRPAKRGHQD